MTVRRWQLQTRDGAFLKAGRAVDVTAAVSAATEALGALGRKLGTCVVWSASGFAVTDRTRIRLK